MEPTDSELMKDLANGNDLALNSLMDSWGGRVAAFLNRMTRDQTAALDLSQETFVKLYQARDRYRPTENFSTYLFSIAGNLARNHARWKARHPALSLDAAMQEGDPAFAETADPHPTPGEAAETAEATRAIEEAFLRLPPDLREAMTLFVHEGMGYADIAAVAGCSKKAVETRIYRARQILKEELKSIA
ncbi:MAG: RNA polymerase sigma factor [Verrucomicrobiota bacterium]